MILNKKDISKTVVKERLSAALYDNEYISDREYIVFTNEIDAVKYIRRCKTCIRNITRFDKFIFDNNTSIDLSRFVSKDYTKYILDLLERNYCREDDYNEYVFIGVIVNKFI